MSQLLAALALLALIVAPGRVSAASIANGSMTDTGGNYNVFNTIIPAGWNNQGGSLNTPDVFDENTDFQGFTWDASSDGGTFVHALAYSASDEGVAQTISGLAIGTQYEISFAQSISNRNGAQTDDAGVWHVTFGSTTLTSNPMTTPAGGVAFGWEAQTLTFLATATTHDLIFLADQATGNSSIRVDLGLDGVSIVAVPEPGTAALLALGLAGMRFARRD